MNLSLNILILEDEQRAGEKLSDLISSASPEAVISWKRSISDAIDFLKTGNKPNLIFSDIELLDGSAFEIYETINPGCPIIFCTAFDRFYVDAFKTNGIAYLLKPYTKEQFADAWHKYTLLFNDQKNITTDHEQVLETIKTFMGNKPQHYKQKFTVKKRDGIFILDVEEVAYFQAQGDFVYAFDQKGRKHILSNSLQSLYEMLNPAMFFMINRSEIIHIDSILKYNPYIKNRLAITLKSPSVELYTSNNRTPKFREWLES